MFEFGPISQLLAKSEEVLVPNTLPEAEIWLDKDEKASFSLIFKISVGPIFQSAGPILRHTALKRVLFTGWLEA